jgi:PHP family Zn ribbon phosphoesterase
MLKAFRADLHIHTCLSPCAELEMTPAAIVSGCAAKGMDLIAVCDHNSAENVGYVRKAAGTKLTVLAGMEVTTAEEAHILALFDEPEQALGLQELVYDHLIEGENDEDLFGLQVVANEQDEVESIVNRLLIGATTLGVDSLLETVHDLGGVAVASHVDRESYSLLGQLGFIPDSLALDAVEVSAARDAVGFAKEAGLTGWPVITASDAHRLSDLGRACTRFYLKEPTTAEIRKAFRGESERTILGTGPAC